MLNPNGICFRLILIFILFSIIGFIQVQFFGIGIGNALKLKKVQNELANIYLKEQKEYIQNQIDKIRNLVEDRQSRITWETMNEVSRRKSTAKAKLKATRQQHRIHLWRQHFENLLAQKPSESYSWTTNENYK